MINTNYNHSYSQPLIRPNPHKQQSFKGVYTGIKTEFSDEVAESVVTAFLVSVGGISGWLAHKFFGGKREQG